jgi:hypothetical protein
MLKTNGCRASSPCPPEAPSAKNDVDACAGGGDAAILAGRRAFPAQRRFEGSVRDGREVRAAQAGVDER